MISLRRLAPLFLLTLLACGDDTSTGGGGGQGGETNGTTAPSSSSGTTSSSTTTTSSSVTSTATTTTGAGGGAECPPILVESGQPLTCQNPGPLALPISSNTDCTDDIATYWPTTVFRLPVTQGQCLHIRADNVGSPAGADLWAAIVDPNGKSLIFDEETPCTVPNPSNFACPEGGVVIETTGDAHIFVGAYPDAGCPAPGSTPFELTASIDGADVYLTCTELCTGDINVIVP